MSLKQRWNLVPFSPGKIPFFYGWVIVLASIVGVLASSPGTNNRGVDFYRPSYRISQHQPEPYQQRLYDRDRWQFLFAYMGRETVRQVRGKMDCHGGITVACCSAGDC
jgi:hypothetical protein